MDRKSFLYKIVKKNSNLSISIFDNEQLMLLGKFSSLTSLTIESTELTIDVSLLFETIKHKPIEILKLHFMDHENFADFEVLKNVKEF